MAEFGPEWRKKVTHFAKVIDMDGDGEVTRKNYEIQGDRFVEVCKLEGALAKQIRGKFLKIWDDFFGAEAKEGQRIFLKNFPDTVQKRGMEKIRYGSQFYGGFIFDAIDLSSSGFIKQKEFEYFFKAMNIDVGAAPECFKALDTDKDGLLSYDDVTQANINFWTQNESTFPSNMLYGPIKD